MNGVKIEPLLLNK